MAEVLTMYIRTECHLCDEMYDALGPWRAKLGFVLQSIDIADEPGLIARLGEKVPPAHARRTRDMPLPAQRSGVGCLFRFALAIAGKSYAAV